MVPPQLDSGSGTATGVDSASGSGRGCWCGGHGPCTGWAATFRYSTSCGNAHTVGLLPVFGAFSISSYIRGLPSLWPAASTRTASPRPCSAAPARARPRSVDRTPPTVTPATQPGQPPVKRRLTWRSAPEGHVDGGLEPAVGDGATAEHGLGGSRGGDEAGHLVGGRG